MSSPWRALRPPPRVRSSLPCGWLGVLPRDSCSITCICKILLRSSCPASSGPPDYSWKNWAETGGSPGPFHATLLRGRTRAYFGWAVSGHAWGTDMGHAGHRGRDIRQPSPAQPTLILKRARHHSPVLLEAWLHCRVPRSPGLPPHQGKCPQAQIESPTNWLASQVGQLGLQIPVTSCVLLPLEHTVSHIFRFPLSTSKTLSS